jgi:hypothetical protein
MFDAAAGTSATLGFSTTMYVPAGAGWAAADPTATIAPSSAVAAAKRTNLRMKSPPLS